MLCATPVDSSESGTLNPDSVPGRARMGVDPPVGFLNVKKGGKYPPLNVTEAVAFSQPQVYCHPAKLT